MLFPSMPLASLIEIFGLIVTLVGSKLPIPQVLLVPELRVVTELVLVAPLKVADACKSTLVAQELQFSLTLKLKSSVYPGSFTSVIPSTTENINSLVLLL